MPNFVIKKQSVSIGEISFKQGDTIKTKSFIELKRRVVLIVALDNKDVYLLREYRPLFGKTVWRVPAGTLEDGEEPLDGAHRELLEETGLVAGKMELVEYYEYMG
ncbi:NUDIX hydrolase, partial [Candidatus Woesearchaeota archaeon]|nr:NUDIX hydrolase [Candidatus Woesearchaeota archaeon]